MKILFLEQFSELGGGQRCLIDLLPAVRDRHWSATVAAPGSGPLFEWAQAAGARTQEIALGPYSLGGKSAADAGRYAVDTTQLARWIATQDADLIYSNAPRPLLAAALGAHGRPVIFHAHSLLSQGYAASLAGWAIRRAQAKVIANSRFVASPLQRCVAPHLIYNGVAEIPFRPRKGVQRIGVIGRVSPEKGQADFLRAAALVVKCMPHVRFVVCGAPLYAPAEYFDEVRRLAAGLPVEFLGWRDDIAAVLEGLDLLVVPSTSAEATTRVILEAFSAGVPVVAGAIGGIPEIVRDGENGFLIPECEPHALARKILEVATLELAPVTTRARADWEQNYTVERYREQVVEVIAACAATSGVRPAA